MEHRDDLSELLLNGLPPEEREHVINVIKRGDHEKLRRLRSDRTPEQREAGDEVADDVADDVVDEVVDDDRVDDGEMADAAE